MTDTAAQADGIRGVEGGEGLWIPRARAANQKITEDLHVGLPIPAPRIYRKAEAPFPGNVTATLVTDSHSRAEAKDPQG
ncbi:unnamed protein product [Gadus morhua 'NCC']